MGGYPLKDRKNLKKLTAEQTAQNKEVILGSGEPGASDDSSNPEITTGTIWVDILTGNLYVCTDPTVDSAVWAAAGGESALWRWGGPAITPTVLVVNGLAVDVGASPGTTVVSVADFIPVVKASNQNITPAFGIATSGSPKPTMHEDPLDAYIAIDCESLGTVLVDIWVEESGTPQNVFTTTYVIVSDEANVCAPE
jgi:hypothetical protein